MVQGKISTYRLRSDLLETYLQSQFPSYSPRDFNVQLSADGKEFYTFDTPEALTKEQMDHIDGHVRLRRDGDADFL